MRLNHTHNYARRAEKVNRHSKGSVIHECDGQSRTAYEESLREDVVPVHIDNQKGVRGYRDDVNICKYVLRLAKIAYLLALDYMRKHERHKHERQSWRSETIEAIFERFEDEGMVMKNLIDKNVIKGRTNFDNLKSLFHSAWYEKWWRMWSQIATGPKVKVVNGKFKGRDKTQKRFVFRATKSEEEIRVFVTEKEKECMKVVGLQRMKDLDARYDALLVRLVELEEQSWKEKV